MCVSNQLLPSSQVSAHMLTDVNPSLCVNVTSKLASESARSRFRNLSQPNMVPPSAFLDSHMCPGSTAYSVTPELLPAPSGIRGEKLVMQYNKTSSFVSHLDKTF